MTPRQKSKAAGNTRYLGKVCLKHSKLNGERQTRSGKCPECIKEYASADVQLAKGRKRAIRVRKELKTVVFAHYGPNCKRCGEDDSDVLNIDHIKGGGAAHRKTIGGRGTGVNMYRWLVTNNFPSGYRVLCFNCNVKLHLLSERRKLT